METAHQFLASLDPILCLVICSSSLCGTHAVTTKEHPLSNAIWESSAHRSKPMLMMASGSSQIVNIRQDRLGFTVITNNSQISNVTWLSSVCLFNHMMVPRWPSMKLHFNRRHQAFFKCEKRGHGELWFVRLPGRSELDWTCKLTSPVLLSRAGKYNLPLCPEGKGDGKCWWVAAMLTTQWVFKASVYPRRCSRSPNGVRRHSGISSYIYSLSSPFKISIFWVCLLYLL